MATYVEDIETLISDPIPKSGPKDTLQHVISSEYRPYISCVSRQHTADTIREQAIHGPHLAGVHVVACDHAVAQEGRHAVVVQPVGADVVPQGQWPDAAILLHQLHGQAGIIPEGGGERERLKVEGPLASFLRRKGGERPKVCSEAGE